MLTTTKLKLALGGTLALGAAASLFLAIGLAPATGESTRSDTLEVTADGDFSPKRLPVRRRAPVKIVGLQGSIRNLDDAGQPINMPWPQPDPVEPVNAPADPGTRPPIAKRIIVDFDKAGTLFTKGLPRCKPNRLRGRNTNQALNQCRRALVARGKTNAVVDFEGQDPFVAPGPLLMFNGPRKGRKPTIVFHVWANPGAPTAFVVRAEVKGAPGKRFGRRVITDELPIIASDNGALTDFRINRVWKRWKHRGKRRSYLLARCKPRRLKVRAFVTFRPDSAFPEGHPRMQVNLTRRCRPRR